MSLLLHQWADSAAKMIHSPTLYTAITRGSMFHWRRNAPGSTIEVTICRRMLIPARADPKTAIVEITGPKIVFRKEPRGFEFELGPAMLPEHEAPEHPDQLAITFGLNEAEGFIPVVQTLQPFVTGIIALKRSTKAMISPHLVMALRRFALLSSLAVGSLTADYPSPWSCRP